MSHFFWFTVYNTFYSVVHCAYFSCLQDILEYKFNNVDDVNLIPYFEHSTFGVIMSGLSWIVSVIVRSGRVG